MKKIWYHGDMKHNMKYMNNYETLWTNMKIMTQMRQYDTCLREIMKTYEQLWNNMENHETLLKNKRNYGTLPCDTNGYLKEWISQIHMFEIEERS